MILDPNGIAASSGEIAVTEVGGAEKLAAREARGNEITTLLVFRAGGGAPKAVPLSLVARLEEIDLAKVEYSNGRPMVQYREKLMPLIPIETDLKLAETGNRPVLVFADGDHAMGLVVDEIIDIVEDKINVELTSDRPGFMGSAIIAGRATDLLDAGHFLTQAYGDCSARSSSRCRGRGCGRSGVLLGRRQRVLPQSVEPAAVGRGLRRDDRGECAGRDVAVRGRRDVRRDRQRHRDAGDERLRVRARGAGQLALAAHADGRAVVARHARGLRPRPRAGFSDYVAKLDRDRILQILETTLLEGYVS